MGRPHLILVTGPPGAGKTTLGTRLAVEVGCPLVSRDAVKEGMVHAAPGYVPAVSDQMALRAYGVFFTVIEVLLRAETTLVAEAAFQHALWRRGLDPLLGLAEPRVIRCRVSPGTARERALRRLAEQPTRAAHADADHLAGAPPFVPLDLPVPTLEVDTGDGYRPDLRAITTFAVVR